MISTQTAIIAAIRAGLVTVPIYWIRGPKETQDAPYIVLQRISESDSLDHDGADGMSEARIQADCYAKASWDTAAELRDQLTEALNGVSGTFGGVKVDSIELTNCIDFYDEAPGLFRAMAEFYVSTNS